MGRRAVVRKRSARNLLTISLALVPLGLLGAGAVGTRAEPADSDAHSQRPPAVSDDQRAVGELIHEVLSAARKRDFVALDRLMVAEFHTRADGSEGSKASALELFRRQPSLLDGIASSIEYGCGSASFGNTDVWLCPPLQTEEKVLQPQRVGFRRLGEGRWTFWFYVPETGTAPTSSADPGQEARPLSEHEQR